MSVDELASVNLSEALKLYLGLKGQGKSVTF